MRTSWASIIVVSALIGGFAFGPNWLALLALPKAWWTVPVAASSASVAALAFSLSCKQAWMRFSVQAYIVPGPAMAIVNLLPAMLPVSAPPFWASGLMPALFLASAWLFYRATREPIELNGQPQETPGLPPA